MWRTLLGTLGILVAAAERDLISFEEALNQLQQTNIRLPKKVLQRYMARFGEENKT